MFKATGMQMCVSRLMKPAVEQDQNQTLKRLQCMSRITLLTMSHLEDHDVLVKFT